MHKAPIGERFIVASKNCGTTPLCYMISKVFIINFNHNIFKEKVYFTHALIVLGCRTFIPSCYKIKWNKYQEKSEKYFNFRLYHIIYSDNKHHSTGHQKAVAEGTLPNKL